MTNSYNLFPGTPPKLIFIHGMNNKASAFTPLMDFFKSSGFAVSLLSLPGHGEERFKNRNFKSAFAEFDALLNEMISTPYSVIAFSHGALYFQLWLEKHPDKRPLAQILLAPAFYIHKSPVIEKLISLLPSSFYVKSFAPKKFRRYETLRIWEYQILIEGMKVYQTHRPGFKAPALILIDPKDELVHAHILREKILEKKDALVTFECWERNYLKKGLGRHHVLFHPDYFSRKDWESFTQRMKDYLLKFVVSDS